MIVRPVVVLPTGRTIIRLYKPTDGEIIYKGKDIAGKLTKEESREVHQSISMIFQDPIASINPRMTVKEIIGEGLRINNLVKSEEELEKLDYLKKFFDIRDDEKIGKITKVIEKEELDRLYTRLEPMIKRRESLVEEKEKLLTYKNNLEILNRADVDIDKIKRLNYFDFRYGEVTKDGRFILKNNYENIPSLIIHLNDEDTKSADAINTLIELDNKTSERRRSVDEIIENEKAESLKVANKIDQTYLEKITKEVAELNKNNEEEISKEASEIKKSFSDKKSSIESLYKDKVDKLVDEAFEKIIKEDGNDR